jgi:hypothetical protein
MGGPADYLGRLHGAKSDDAVLLTLRRGRTLLKNSGHFQLRGYFVWSLLEMADAISDRRG